MSRSPHRSFAPITRRDLQRLADIATADFQDLFRLKPSSRPYSKKLRLICLCQGAARHYVHGDHGVHDFDQWGFFQKHPNQPFPYRRQGQHDFGPSKFGHNSEDSDRFVGRQVGVFGRSINMRSPKMPIEAVQRWLSEARTKSARFLAQQSAVVIWPRRDLGRVIWDGGKQVDA
jgi:hypothetical protein